MGRFNFWKAHNSNYTGLIPHLIGSVKELVKQNEQLKVENASAKRQNEAITDRLDALETTISKMLDSQVSMPTSGK